MAKQAQEQIQGNGFQIINSLAVEALRRYLETHRDELIERFIREDVEFCEMSLNLQHRIALVDQLMEKLHLPILIEIDEDGRYIVSCPLFKGCHSWGETIDEAMKNISEVIEMCLEETMIENLNTFVGFRELEVVHDAKASCDWQVGS